MTKWFFVLKTTAACLLICLPSKGFTQQFEPKNKKNLAVQFLAKTETNQEKTAFEIPQKNTGPRDYFKPVSEEKKEDIRFIVTTLADKPPTKLWSSQKDLEEAGKRVSDVHPLRFVLVIFSDEQMKVGMHNLIKRGWVWENFTKGLRESFDQEASYNNITEPMIKDFSNKLKIQESTIKPQIKQKQWNEFLQTLVTKVPREEGSDRYGI